MASSAWSLYYHNISPCLNKRGLPEDHCRSLSAGGGLLHFLPNTSNPKRQQQPLRRLQMQLQKQEETKEDHGHDRAASTSRRQFMLQVPLMAFSFSQLVISNALAIAEIDVPQDFRDYTDEVNKYKLLIPQDWQVGAGEPNSFKSITAFYPEEAANSNVSVAISGSVPTLLEWNPLEKLKL